MKRIPAFRLVPEPLSEEARQLPGFKWAAADIANRHQLGGEPVRHITDDRWPVCPDCEQRMTFYGALGSINDEFCIADAGVICVFVCFDCNEVRATIESA